MIDELKSQEEVEFYFYLRELLQMGYIKAFSYEPQVFTLFEKRKIGWYERLRTKLKPRESTLLHECTYTPDWRIEWTDKAIDVFICEYQRHTSQHYFFHDNLITWIDTKGSGIGSAKNSSHFTFPIKQKWLFQTKGIFVQKVVPLECFNQTFFPMKIASEYICKIGKRRGEPKKGVKNFRSLSEWKEIKTKQMSHLKSMR